MGFASASRAGTGWSSFVKGWRSRGTDGNTVAATSGSASRPNEHARLFGAPHDANAERWETWLRRAIPAMIVVLLGVVALSRVSMLMDGANDIDRNTRQGIGLAATLTVERLLDSPGLEDIGSDAILAGKLLSAARPSSDENVGRRYLLATSVGEMIAIHPDERTGTETFTHEIQDRAAIVAGLPRLIIALAGNEGAGRVALQEGSYVGASRKVTVLPSGATLLLLVVENEASLYADWMRNIAIEAIMVAAIALTVMIVMLAYLRQNVRSREGEVLHSELQNRYHTALQRGRCGLWDWDLSRGRVFWSTSMFEILGWERGDEVLALAEIAAWVHPEDLDLMVMGNDAFESPANSIDRRFRMKTAEGSWMWMRIRAELVSYHGSDPHLIGIAVDISEQEALERQSERADTRLRDAVESISEAFVLWDSRRRLVLWNRKFQQFYALDDASLVRGARYDDIDLASRKHLSRRKVNALRETEPGASTQEVELEDGRWLQVNERRTKDGGLVSVQTDITQIKRNEEKLLQSESRLMATVADLKETQLQLEINAQHLIELADMHKEAQEKAEAGNRTKSDFLANVSHELRTPLNAILGFSDIMTSEMFGPLGSDKYSEYATDIHQSGEFLLGVINDVLDMSKIEAGRLQLQPETIDLTRAVDESLRIIDVQAAEKELVVHRSVPDAVEIEADRRALKQILLNLLSNAVKFTPRGGEIHVKIRREDGLVKLAIADTGCGIGKDALRRIGVPFEQAQNQFTKNHKGSGLGLAIARSLAELHGGALHVRSVEGKGTFVLVRLPEAQAPGALMLRERLDDRPLAQLPSKEIAANWAA